VGNRAKAIPVRAEERLGDAPRPSTDSLDVVSLPNYGGAEIASFDQSALSSSKGCAAMKNSARGEIVEPCELCRLRGEYFFTVNPEETN